MELKEQYVVNKEYEMNFKDLIKCYKDHYEKKTKDFVMDIVFFICNNVYQHHLLLSASGKQYIASPAMKQISAKYDCIIPLADKTPYFPGYLIIDGGLIGVMDLECNEIIPCQYRLLTPYCFVEKANPNKNVVTMATVALFGATRPSWRRELLALDGRRVFSGYDFVDRYKTETEYMYYYVDDFKYYTTCERWTSLILTSDFESRYDNNWEIPECSSCIYQINDIGENYELLRLESDLSKIENQKLPKRGVVIRKVKDFTVDKEALITTILKSEEIFGLTLREYLLRLSCKTLSKDTAIEILDLSVRDYNSLRRAGFKTVYDFCTVDESDLLKIKNISKAGKEELVFARNIFLDILRNGHDGSISNPITDN